MATVDRNAWIEQRLRFLHERLEAGVSDEERSAIEAEMATLRRGQHRLRRWLLRLGGGRS